MTWAVVVSLLVNAVGAFLLAAGLVLLYQRLVRPKSSRLVVARVATHLDGEALPR